MEETQFLIFDYLFSSKFKNTSIEDMVHSLTIMAKEYINHLYYSQERTPLSNDKILYDYFESLINELIEFRDKELNDSERSIVASIQNSIVESNKDLKQYIDSKFDTIKNYSLAKYLTDEKIDELLNRSINYLGGRYNPRANVETITKDIFKSLLFDDEIKELLKTNIEVIANNLDNLINLLSNI